MELPSRKERYNQKQQQKKRMLGIITGLMMLISVFILYTFNWRLSIFVVPLTIILGNLLFFHQYKKLSSFNILLVLVAAIISLEISYRFSLPN